VRDQAFVAELVLRHSDQLDAVTARVAARAMQPGVVTFSVLAAHQHGSVAPNWPTGIALGAGGLAGGYVGARMHARMPETIIRRLLALVVIAIGIRYLVGGLTGGV
jgi:uncharacterized membrane protein YfcA